MMSTGERCMLRVEGYPATYTDLASIQFPFGHLAARELLRSSKIDL